METHGAATPRTFRPRSFGFYLFAVTILLVLAMLIHSNIVIARLNTETKGLCTVLARFFAVSSLKATEDPEVQSIMYEVVRSVEFPLVLTDDRGIPRAWRKVAILPQSVPDSVLAIAYSRGAISEPVARLQAIARELDRVNVPVPVVRLGHPDTLGLVHYGEPPLVRQLRWVPWLEAFAIAGLVLFGLVGLRSLARGEQRSLWAALAKETAHQLGTPLSSLMGWTAILKDEAARGPLGADRIAAVADEMDRDLVRLQRVASRFGQVGSKPTLREGDLIETVSGAVAYFRSRLPHLGRTVTIEEHYQPIPPVLFHRDLIEWVTENLIRNALDAVDKTDGRIEVVVQWKRADRAVEIQVRDNGRGMSPNDRRHAFDPGFTTKQRGWGLGLALARRVVREYHDGRISILESAPGRGTIISVALPVARP